ncbi:MAG: hypothetical protein VX642_13095 [Bdellovibrionota bacterium]|nr:hypothetical protein [Bdellovibrionota bacterium]
MKKFRSLFPNFKLFSRADVFYQLKVKTKENEYWYNPKPKRNLAAILVSPQFTYFHWMQSQMEYSLFHNAEGFGLEMMDLVRIDHRNQSQKGKLEGEVQLLVYENKDKIILDQEIYL